MSFDFGSSLSFAATHGRQVQPPYNGPDIGVLGYGQSNWVLLTTNTDNPPAALDGTMWWDGSSWGAVPDANGIREMLNAVKTANPTKTVGIVSGGHSGASLAELSEGGTYFAELAADVAASGIRNAEALYSAFAHGETDAAAGTTQAVYLPMLDDLHGAQAALVSRTKATLPMLIALMGTAPNAASTDAQRDTMQRTLIAATEQLEGLHLSHSNMDATLNPDGIHLDAVSYGRAGARYARTINYLRGIETAPAYFYFDTASAIGVSATETRISVVHLGGTDVAPATGTTGFEVSDDNGATWVSAVGARIDAATIALTHIAIGTAIRLVRYQYGTNPNVTAPLKDNTALAVPILPSAGTISVAMPASPPVPTWISDYETNSSTDIQAVAAVNLGADANDRLVIISGSIATGGTMSSVTLTPDGGSPIAGTIRNQESPQTVWFVDLVVPGGTSGVTNCTIDVVYTANPFSKTSLGVWTVPAANLASLAPVDTVTEASTGTVHTLDIATSADGFWLAGSTGSPATSNAATWTGDEAGIIERYDALKNGSCKTFADASETAAHSGDNTIAVTFAQSGAGRLTAVSYR